MKPDPSSPILLYDGICPMCQGFVYWLNKLGLTHPVNVTPWEEADPQITSNDATLAERIRVEVLLVDPTNKQIYGGIDALRQLARMTPQYHWLAQVLELPLVYESARFLYETISYNRRLLSPPKRNGVTCECDPPDSPTARLHLLLLIILFVTLVVSLVFCASGFFKAH